MCFEGTTLRTKDGELVPRPAGSGQTLLTTALCGVTNLERHRHRRREVLSEFLIDINKVLNEFLIYINKVLNFVSAYLQICNQFKICLIIYSMRKPHLNHKNCSKALKSCS